jgi:putative sigma-54 modulation protein
MKIRFHSQHTDVPPPLREQMEKRLNRLERYFDNIVDTEVHISQQRSFMTAEITLSANGKLIRAEERAADFRTAIDLAADKLEKQIKHYKERNLSKDRRPARRPSTGADQRQLEAAAESSSMNGIAGSEGLPAAPRIARRKQFPAEMMSAEDAAERMQLLGHSFYLFLNDETHQLNVVYERREGDYGVLEPQIELDDD